VISSASQADAIVAGQLARGCRFVKLYENLPLATYDALGRACIGTSVREGCGEVDQRHDPVDVPAVQSGVDC